MPLMDELMSVADRHGIPLIEDAAEALGSTYKGRKAGSFGVGSTFSFHRTKTLTTGEGGMLILDDDHLFERCTILRDHGRRPGGKMYFNEEVTYKYMPFNVQAALGYAQFHRLDELIGRKREIYEWYKDGLQGIEDIELNAEPEGGFNSVWITALAFGRSHNLTKARAMERLLELNVPSRPFFYPLSSLPAYPGREAEGRRRNPVAYDVSDRAINLPGAMNLTREQVDFVCAGIRTMLQTPVPA
jgi:perosamine synthetase